MNTVTYIDDWCWQPRFSQYNDFFVLLYMKGYDIWEKAHSAN